MRGPTQRKAKKESKTAKIAGHTDVVVGVHAAVDEHDVGPWRCCDRVGVPRRGRHPGTGQHSPPQAARARPKEEDRAWKRFEEFGGTPS